MIVLLHPRMIICLVHQSTELLILLEILFYNPEGRNDEEICGNQIVDEFALVRQDPES